MKARQPLLCRAVKSTAYDLSLKTWNNRRNGVERLENKSLGTLGVFQRSSAGMGGRNIGRLIVTCLAFVKAKASRAG